MSREILLNNQLLADEEFVRDFGNDMESDDGENEAESHDHDDDRVDSQTAGLVSVELQHGAARAAGASRSGGGRSLIRLSSLSFLVVSSSSLVVSLIFRLFQPIILTEWPILVHLAQELLDLTKSQLGQTLSTVLLFTHHFVLINASKLACVTSYLRVLLVHRISFGRVTSHTPPRVLRAFHPYKYHPFPLFYRIGQLSLMLKQSL